MSQYNTYRKIIATILGTFWGYRVNIAIGKSITFSQYIISFLFVMLFFIVLSHLISKEKRTSNIKIIKKEIWKDVVWALISSGIGFLLPLVFGWVFV